MSLQRSWYEWCRWLTGTSCCTLRSTVSFTLRSHSCWNAPWPWLTVVKEVEPGHLCAVQDFSYGLLYLGLLHWPDQRSVRTTSESVLFLPTLLPSLLPFRGISMPAPFKGSPHIQCLNFTLSLTLYRCFFSSLANLVLSCHLLLRGLELTEGINKI